MGGLEAQLLIGRRPTKTAPSSSPFPVRGGHPSLTLPPPGFGSRSDPGGRRMLRDPSLEREEAAKENWHPKMEDSLER